jgi:hypothetical protein
LVELLLQRTPLLLEGMDYGLKEHYPLFQRSKVGLDFRRSPFPEFRWQGGRRVHGPRVRHPKTESHVLCFDNLNGYGRRNITMSQPLLHLAISALLDKAFVAAVARRECTHRPGTSSARPISLA